MCLRGSLAVNWNVMSLSITHENKKNNVVCGLMDRSHGTNKISKLLTNTTLFNVQSIQQLTFIDTIRFVCLIDKLCLLRARPLPGHSVLRLMPYVLCLVECLIPFASMTEVHFTFQ